MKNIFRYLLFLLIPIGVYIFYSSFLWSWIVDDAGITFAYAKNLANGHGLVSWPGEVPVEGFSNFLWTLILSFFHWIGVFDPYLTPKILSSILVLISFFYILRISNKMMGSLFPGMLINLLLAVNSPFVIWTNSGLENALFICLLLALAWNSLKTLEQISHKKIGVLCFLSFLVAITRPEGMIYSIAFPFVLLFLKGKIKFVVLYVLGTGLLMSFFLLFRFWYFHDWVPNTYYIKFHHEGSMLEKLQYLSFGIGGRWVKILLVFHFFFLFSFFRKLKEKKPAYGYVCVLYILSIIQFFVLPSDWMGELRFATPFIVFVYLTLFIHLSILWNSQETKTRLTQIAAIVLWTGFIGYSFYHFHNRTLTFSKNPTVPFAEVKTEYADKFNDYAEKLDLKNATLLLPDVGATLYYSKIKIYDAAGLCDKNIRIKIPQGQQALQDYVVNELKPTFIHLHGRWAEMYALYDNEKFFKDYISLQTEEILPSQENLFYPITSGDYLRRDAIDAHNQSTYDSLFIMPIR